MYDRGMVYALQIIKKKHRISLEICTGNLTTGSPKGFSSEIEKKIYISVTAGDNTIL